MLSCGKEKIKWQYGFHVLVKPSETYKCERRSREHKSINQSVNPMSVVSFISFCRRRKIQALEVKLVINVEQRKKYVHIT
jgi:hypothetical protein